MRRWLLLALLAVNVAHATDFDYQLAPRQIAADTWVVEGRNEDFAFANGGNIVNTAFIVTGAGVVVIDSGPSRAYGEQLRAAIARITEQPVVRVWNTHHHPDHFLGNQAFADAPVHALPQTIADMQQDGNAFTENMYRLNGDAMAGTEMRLPQHAASAGTETFGKHRLALIALSGHTAADLVIFDHSTGVLFASDLLFHRRAPTTPHAKLTRWLASLDVLEALNARVIVPGHGPVSNTAEPIRQTRAWLTWLGATLTRGAQTGLDMNELTDTVLPAEQAAMAEARAEFIRSIAHLYPQFELDVLERD